MVKDEKSKDEVGAEKAIGKDEVGKAAVTEWPHLVVSPRWEYRVLRRWNSENLDAQLNALGAEGWELVAFVANLPILKRQA